MNRNSHQSNKGFTLIELVLAMLVLSIVGVAVSGFMSNSVRAYVVATDNARGVDEVRYAFNRLSQEIRQINHDGTLYELNTDITLAVADTTFSFVNVDGDTVTINYDPVAKTLTLSDDSIGVSAFTLANNVTDFNFNYYQADGNNLANDGTDIAFVEFQLRLQEGEVMYSTRSRVALRDKAA